MANRSSTNRRLAAIGVIGGQFTDARFLCPRMTRMIANDSDRKTLTRGGHDRGTPMCFPFVNAPCGPSVTWLPAIPEIRQGSLQG